MKTERKWALFTAAASLLVGAAGCAFEGVDAAGSAGAGGEANLIESADQAILGGTSTSGRPEIGRLTRKGRTCTGTLITPEHALVAAQCLDSIDWQDTSVNVNDRFTVVVGGTTVQRSVTKYFSFGRYFTDKIFNGLSSDVAVLQLSSAITGVTPVAIADTRSRSSTAWSTRFGYGCTNRDTSAGAGTKRWFAFQGLVSNVTCGGDAGGPTMKGQGVNAAPLYAIQSGTAFDLSAGGTFDIVADATYHKKYVEGVLTNWNGTTMRDVDRLGADYKSVASAANTCPGACASEDRCQAWTWYAGVCHLKDAIPGFTPLIGAYSGIKPNRVDDDEIGYDRPGSGYSTFAVANQAACNTECANDYRCQSYTYGLNGSGQRTCWLKDEQPPLVRNAGFRSKTKRGFRMNVQRRTSDGALFHSFAYSMPSPEICQSDCAKRANCQSWTYLGGGLGRDSQCWLYDEKGSGSASTGYVSGVKGEEFR